MLKVKLLALYNNYLKKLGAKGVYADVPYPDIHTSFPEAKIFEEHYPAILEEYKNLLELKIQQKSMLELGLYGGNDKNILPWNKDKNSIEELNAQFDWRSTFIKVGSEMIESNAKHCPTTAKLVRNMPYIYNVFFSYIGPGTVIAPHYGYTKAVLRYHLGLIIPPNNQCSLTVNGINYHWKAGESVVFDDMFLHSAENNSDQFRVILYADFLRPLPFPYNIINKMIARIIIILTRNQTDKLKAFIK